MSFYDRVNRETVGRQRLSRAPGVITTVAGGSKPSPYAPYPSCPDCGYRMERDEIGRDGRCFECEVAA